MFNTKKKEKAPEDKDFKIPESISSINGHLYEYAINHWLGGKGLAANGATAQGVAASASKNKKDVGTVSRELKDGTLFLSTQDLLDIYMNADIGVDDKVHIKPEYLHKYGIDNPEVKTVNVNGVNIPVTEFTSTEAGKDVANLAKKPETAPTDWSEKWAKGWNDAKATATVKPVGKDYNLDGFEVPAQPKEKTPEKTVEKEYDLDGFEVEGKTKERTEEHKVNEEVNKIANEQPITPIADDQASLEKNYAGNQQAPKDQPLVTPGDKAYNLDGFEVDVPKEKAKEHKVEQSTASSNQKEQPQRSDEWAKQWNEAKATGAPAREEKKEEQKSAEWAKQWDEAKATGAPERQEKKEEQKSEEWAKGWQEAKATATPVCTCKEKPDQPCPACSKKDEFIHVQDDKIRYVEKEQPIKESKEFTELKEMHHEEAKNAPKASTPEVVAIDEDKVSEFNKYSIDAKRKIYVINADDARKSFGISPDMVDQRVVAQGNVLRVYSGQSNLLLSAPYGTLEQDYLNDNVFFLPDKYTVAVERHIPETTLHMNNFKVAVKNVAFRLPRDKRIIVATDADIDKYLEAKATGKYFDRKTNTIEIDDSGVDKINVIKNTTNDKIDIVAIFNKFYEMGQTGDRVNDRRIKIFNKMIEQILMDADYYAGSKLLVLNYAEVLLFLVRYYDFGLENVYTMNTKNVNDILYKTVMDAYDNNLNRIPSHKEEGDKSYFIPAHYDYVLYNGQLFNIADDTSLNEQEVKSILLTRPTYMDEEFFDMSPNNFERLEIISPFINFGKYYAEKRIIAMTTIAIDQTAAKLQENAKGANANANGATANSENANGTGANGEQSKAEAGKSADEANKAANTKNASTNPDEESLQRLTLPEGVRIEDGIVYLTERELMHIYQHSHVTEAGTLYTDTIEADRFGLNNPLVKAVSVNGQIIPVSAISKSRMDRELEDEQKFISAEEKAKK